MFNLTYTVLNNYKINVKIFDLCIFMLFNPEYCLLT